MDFLSILTIIFAVLSVLVIIGTVIYLKYDKKKKNQDLEIKNQINNTTEQKKLSKKEISEMEKLIGIDDISKGIIKTLDDNRLCAVFSMSTPDIELLTEDECYLFEDMLMGFNLSLSFPIQTQTKTTKVDLSEMVTNLETHLNNDTSNNEKLTEYRKRLMKSFSNFKDDKKEYIITSYLVVSTRPNLELKRALRELSSRIESVVFPLEQAGIKMGMLDTKQAIQILHEIFNKESAISVNDLVENGALDLYSDGLGLLLDINSEENLNEAV